MFCPRFFRDERFLGNSKQFNWSFTKFRGYNLPTQSLKLIAQIKQVV
jgi:hypothetical protein